MYRSWYIINNFSLLYILFLVAVRWQRALLQNSRFCLLKQEKGSLLLLMVGLTEKKDESYDADVMTNLSESNLYLLFRKYHRQNDLYSLSFILMKIIWIFFFVYFIIFFYSLIFFLSTDTIFYRVSKAFRIIIIIIIIIISTWKEETKEF